MYNGSIGATHTFDGTKIIFVIDLFDGLLHRDGVFELQLLVAHWAIWKVNLKRYLWHFAAVLGSLSTKA